MGYAGYDALLPFQNAQKDHYFPYTPSWHGVAAFNIAAGMILEEGLEAVFARHQQVTAFCRQELIRLGFELFPLSEAVPAPTVTAVHVPQAISWRELDARLRAKGLVVGGSYGALANKVFRIGHMGSQADMLLVDEAMGVLAEVVKTF